MNYLEFEKELASSRLEPLYVVTGEEDFLKLQVIKLLRGKIGEERTFFKEYKGDTPFPIQDIFSELYSQALFEEFNLIILRSADPLLTQLHDPLVQYLQKPSKSACLIIEAGKLDSRTKFAKFVKEKAILIECAPLRAEFFPWQKGKNKEPELIQWLYNRAMFYKKKISSDAAYLLAEYIGNSLSEIDLQLQKISIFIQDKPEIQITDIQSVVQGSKRVNIFEVVDAILDGQVGKAMKMVHLLFERGFLDQDGDAVYDPQHIMLQFLRILHMRVKQMWKISVAKEAVGMPEFVKRKLLEQSRHFPKERLSIFWNSLLETEMAVKTSQMPPEIALESLVTRLLSIK